jgi:predicted TIM-barrel fold metal-dependent hydrolase
MHQNSVGVIMSDSVVSKVRSVRELGVAIVDADGHVTEPVDMWSRFLPEKFRKDAIQVVKLPDGSEAFSLDGQVATLRALPAEHTSLGQQNAPGGFAVGKKKSQRWADGVRGGFDPAERIKALDTEGIWQVPLFPTLMLMGNQSRNNALNVGASRAYNEYLVEYCSHNPERLLHVAVMPFGDVDASIEELKRAKDVYHSVAVCMHPNAYGDKAISDPRNEPFWSAAEEAGMPIGLHVTPVSFKPATPGNLSAPYNDWFLQRWSMPAAIYPTDQLFAFTALAGAGVYERYPRLKFAFLEGGCAWLPDHLDRCDRLFKEEGWLATERLSMLPSEYFRRQCWISSDLDERYLPQLIDCVGANRVMWSSDYPHPEAKFPHSFDEIMERDDIDDEVRRGVLSYGAKQFFGLSN